MTDFKDILIKYMEELDCSSKELADSSGLSAATISRYRSGERIPDVESDNLKQLIYGIVKFACKIEKSADISGKKRRKSECTVMSLIEERFLFWASLTIP